MLRPGAATDQRSGLRRFPELLNQAGDSLRRLRALSEPVFRALEVDPQPLLTAGGDWIEKAKPLY
jgi:hypothetical protein